MVEAGYKNLDLDFWHILFAPAGTPRPIIDKLNAALRQALADAKVVKAVCRRAAWISIPADQWTPEAAAAMLKSEIKRWGDVVRANNIAVQQYGLDRKGSSCRHARTFDFAAGRSHRAGGRRLRRRRTIQQADHDDRPYPPGGATDAIARIIQDSMTKSLGQQIVIENIGGAGGMIGAARAARAAPDGYTIMIHQVALAAGMALYHESHVRRREGFRRHRSDQQRRLDGRGAPDAAAEQHRRTGEVDEGARP